MLLDDYQALSPFKDDNFILFHTKLIFWMMFEIDTFREILFVGRVFNIWIFSVCHQDLQVFWRFVSNQKLAALYIEVCFKSIIYSWFYVIIFCSNILAEKYLVNINKCVRKILLLVLRAGCGIWLYQFLIIAYRFTLPAPLTYETLFGPNSKKLYFWSVRTLMSDDECNFILFLNINIEMLNKLTEFKENPFFG